MAFPGKKTIFLVLTVAAGAFFLMKNDVSLKLGAQFPKKCQKTLFFHSKSEPHGTLHRIQRIHYFPAETQHPLQNRPWVPRAGGQDYGSLHKLPQIIFTILTNRQFWPTGSCDQLTTFGQPSVLINHLREFVCKLP